MFNYKKVKDGRYSTLGVNCETFHITPPLQQMTLFPSTHNLMDGSFDSIEGFNTPNWVLEVQNGRVIISPLRRYHVTRQHTGTTFTCGPYPNWYGGGYEVYRGDFAGLVERSVESPGLLSESADRGRLVQVVLTTAYSRINKVNVHTGVVFGELASSLQTLRNPYAAAFKNLRKMGKILTRTTSTLTSVKRGVVRTRKMGGWETIAYLRRKGLHEEAANLVSNAVLESSYAWRSMLMDYQGALNTIIPLIEKLQQTREVARAHGEISREYSSSFADVPTISGITSFGNVSATVEMSVDAGVVFSRVEGYDPNSVWSNLGLDARNLPLDLYELAPYSFLVDYFSNTGKWLDAITPDPNINIIGSWVTDQTSRDTHYSGSLKQRWFNVENIGDLGSSTVTTYIRNRTSNPEVDLTPVLDPQPMGTMPTILTACLANTRILKLLRG